MTIDLLKFMTRRGAGLRNRFHRVISAPSNATGSAVTTSLALGTDERTAQQWDGDQTVTAAWLTPDAVLTSSASNPTVNVVRVDPTTGTVVATVATLSLASTALVVGRAVALTVNAANAALNPGELLQAQVVTPATTGTALPNCLLEVEMARPA